MLVFVFIAASVSASTSTSASGDCAPTHLPNPSCNIQIPKDNNPFPLPLLPVAQRLHRPVKPELPPLGVPARSVQVQHDELPVVGEERPPLLVELLAAQRAGVGGGRAPAPDVGSHALKPLRRRGDARGPEAVVARDREDVVVL